MDVKLPRLGEGADSGVVVTIMVKEGDQIEEGQTLMELENEKAVAPIPSTASGVVSRIHVKEGDTVSVGQLLLSLSTGGDGAESKDTDAEKAESDEEAESEKETEPEEEQEESERAEVSSRSKGKAGGRREKEKDEAQPAAMRDKPASKVAASPTVRKISKELGIELGRVRGTERGGRIGMGDLRNYVQFLQQIATRSKPAEAKPQSAPAESIDFGKWGPVTRKPLSPLRKTIGARMAENWNVIPHVTQFDEADVTELMALRKKHAPGYEAEGVRLTLTGFVFKAVGEVLKRHPIFNSSLDEAAGELVLKEYCHVGLAVDTEAGLIVPVVRDVDRKNLFDLSREIEELAAKARDRKASREELRGGSFTISNQGGIGGGHFTPIVNKPEVAILGLGRGVLKPMVRDNKIEPRMMLPLALSYDHRVIDGGAAARFIVDLVQALEGFSEEAVKR
jgi:pyruvate dehydrogenase E2 component (dihydrolipoamide acetyltransferase)